MNKLVIIVIGIVIVVGAMFALKGFYMPGGPPIYPITSETPSPRQSPIEPTPSFRGATPPAEATKTSAPTPTTKPTTVKPPATSSNILDRIEAAIRAKLKR